MVADTPSCVMYEEAKEAKEEEEDYKQEEEAQYVKPRMQCVML